MKNDTSSNDPNDIEKLKAVLDAVIEARRRLFEMSNQMIREGRQDIARELDLISGILYRSTLEDD